MIESMNYKAIGLLAIFSILMSCNDQNDKRLAEQAKEAKRKEVILKSISENWSFIDTPINEVSQQTVADWPQWDAFLKEIGGSPRKSIGAYQKKSAAIAKKVDDLPNSIPLHLAKTNIRSRISILITKVKMLDLYIHLDRIPTDKVAELVSEINKELVSLQRQMDKVVTVSKIQYEEGEPEMLQMLKDTARAIPNVMMNPNQPRIE